MGILYRNSSGVETMVAGIAPAGQLIPSVSLYQKGSITNTTSIASKDYARIEITFDIPMPDTDYVVDLQTMQGSGLANAFCDAYGKGTSGFAIILANPSDNNVPANLIQVVWRAFKLMTDEVTALDEAKIEQNTKNFAPNFSATSSYAVGDYTTYQGVLYRCTVAHTQLPWNSSHFEATNVGSEIKGATIVKKGTWTGEQILYPMGDAQVRDRFNIPITFDTPMPDSNYTVIIEFFESRYVTIRSASKTASGFHIEGANADNEQNSTLTKITWTAIRFPS